MTSPVRPPSQADQAWADLAAQRTPAHSLARIDTVTGRPITTITVLSTLLTGLGALAAGQFTASTTAQDLAAATVATASGTSYLPLAQISDWAGGIARLATDLTH